MKRAPAYFESNLRWVLASDRHSEHGVLFLPSTVIRRYLAGGGVGEKHNNVQTRIFEEIPFLKEGELIIQLRDWFGPTAPLPIRMSDATKNERPRP